MVATLKASGIARYRDKAEKPDSDEIVPHHLQELTLPLFHGAGARGPEGA